MTSKRVIHWFTVFDLRTRSSIKAIGGITCCGCGRSGYCKGRMLGTKKVTTPPSNLDILDQLRGLAVRDGDHPP
jgi:hypothetical protein